jgi:hypothetical protein
VPPAVATEAPSKASRRRDGRGVGVFAVPCRHLEMALGLMRGSKVSRLAVGEGHASKLLLTSASHVVQRQTAGVSLYVSLVVWKCLTLRRLLLGAIRCGVPQGRLSQLRSS